jgi:ABC-2 type transport system ATP-binding protein
MLSASRLTRRFDERLAVDDVSFEVASGEIFALLGPNGAGKTTTLRMLAGLIEPTAGTVRIDGDVMTRITATSLRGRIGFLTEAPGLWDRLPVRQNLQVYARLHGLSDPERRVDEALSTFDLAARAGDPAAQLSKGLRQRVALARTLLHRPSVVLLDEPTAGLDPEAARGVRELILQLRQQGRAILLSTHNLDEVERVADRVAVLRGRMVASDTPQALRARLFGARLRIVLDGPAARFAELLRQGGTRDVQAEESVLSIAVKENSVDAPPIVRALVEAGAGIRSVAPEEAPLEEIYLKLLSEHPS